MELSVAVLILVMVFPVIAQLTYWSLRQRARLQSQQTALELANNILEAARAMPADALTPQWILEQTIPEDVMPLLPEGTLSVQIEDVSDKSPARRVTAIVTWQTDDVGPHREVRLVTLLNPRAHPAGAQP